MQSVSLPRSRREGLSLQTIGDEVLLYDEQHDKAHVLNHTAVLVWKYADGTRSVSELARRVSLELGLQIDAPVVWYALAQLDKAGLLDRQPNASPWLKMTRRDFLKTAGTTALIIPVVKSISSISSNRSTSCFGEGGPCTEDIECCAELFCFENECVFDCFTGNTQLWFSDGTRRPIETAQVGDLILSRDEKSGEIAPQPIAKLYAKSVPAAFDLHLDNDIISTTFAHPFYTDGGWARANDLRAGIDLTLESGARATLNEIVHPQPHVQTVYNLTVSGFHTYFVGQSGVWVHNKG